MENRGKKNKKRRLNNMVVPVSAAKLIKSAAIGEEDDSNLNVAKNRELSGLLQQSRSSLAESDMAITPIFD